MPQAAGLPPATAGRPSGRALTLAALLALASVAAFLFLAELRESFATVRGDEGTYLAMAESLAFDADLRLGVEDVDRLVATRDAGRQAVILQQVEGEDFYSKPALYPLLASPFYRFAGGPQGLVLLNVLALGGALWCAWRVLRRYHPDRALLTLVSFAGSGALLSYVAWRTADLVQVAAVLAGLALCLGPLTRRGMEARSAVFTSPVAAFAGGLLLGLAGALRLTNLFMVTAPLLALILEGRRRRAAVVATGVAVAVLGGVLCNWWLAGAPSPYRTERATFDATSGYPAGDEAPRVNRYETSYSKVRIRSPRIRPVLSAYAGLYFLVGRHSGLLLYTPVALLLLFAALRRPDRTSLAMLSAALGLALIYLLWLPHNYFGGGACIGNRYFLVAYAALPFAARPLRWRSLAVGWLLAAVAFLSAVQSQAIAGDLDRSSQSHVYAGAFRWLPYESTAESIEGSRERFWPKEDWELIHFTDPFAGVGDWTFRLSSQSPPTELEVANQRPGGPLRFLVLSPAPHLRLLYRDWRRTVEVELERPLGEQGLVEIQPALAWRRHPLWFWWNLSDRFAVHLFTLAVETPDGTPVEAEVRYLGSMGLPHREFYQRTVLSADLPAFATPGGRSLIDLEVRNDGDGPWLSGDVLPVHLGYAIACPGMPPVTGPRRPLAETVMPEEVLETTLEVQWPDVELPCELRIDLVVEGVTWFSEHTDGPIALGTVVLRKPAADVDSSQITGATATPSRRMSRERSGPAADSR